MILQIIFFPLLKDLVQKISKNFVFDYTEEKANKFKKKKLKTYFGLNEKNNNILSIETNTNNDIGSDDEDNDEQRNLKSQRIFSDDNEFTMENFLKDYIIYGSIFWNLNYFYTMDDRKDKIEEEYMKTKKK